jgi:DsbC/DsbD-like thiol-disulfide interchange protein
VRFIHIGLASLLSSIALANNPVDVSKLSRANIIALGDVQSSERRLGLELTIAPGWYAYWQNPGDAGLPPKWKAQEGNGITFLDFEWPVPQKFTSKESASYGYTQGVILPFIAKLDATSKNPVWHGQLRWLVCKDICVPQKQEIRLTWDEIKKLPLDKIKEAQVAKQLPPKTTMALKGVINKSHNHLIVMLTDDFVSNAKSVVFLPTSERQIEDVAEQKYVAKEKTLQLMIDPRASQLGSKVDGLFIADFGSLKKFSYGSINF